MSVHVDFDIMAGPNLGVKVSTTGDLPFLQQILNRLVGKGFVRSKQGRGGGYQLACDPKKVTLKAVIDTIEGIGARKCLLDSTGCNGWRGCRLAPTWHPVRETLIAFLDMETIHSVAERSRGAVDRFRLSDPNG